MLVNMLRSLTSLLFPPRCIVCGDKTGNEAQGICSSCYFRIPLTYSWNADKGDNPTRRLLEGMVPLVQASSFYFYVDGSPWRRLVHRFKYGGEWRIALTMGRWYGSELKATGFYDDVDIVVPVPLHRKKQMLRGYNQSQYIAEGIARELGREVVASAVRRVHNNPPQARSHAHDRWDNVEGIFAVRRAEPLRGRHILLVDDVLTTGATLSSCARAIVDAVPDCRISVATLAITHKVMRN